MWDPTNISQDLWEHYGFSSNPFDTNPLTSHSEMLPLGEALVGRDSHTRESKTLTSILRNSGGARVMIEGEIGVGKTTFVNYHRHIWENYSKDKLFSTKKEITITPEWRLHHFLANLLSAIINKLLHQKGEKELLKIPVFKEVLALSRVLFPSGYSLQVSWKPFGIGYGKTADVNVPTIPEVQLMEYFEDVVREIKNMGYAGLLLHLDNLELLNRENLLQAQSFFEEIRDSLQMPDVYFVFVASRGFFREVISPLERVRSIFFGRPVVVPPLRVDQVLEAVYRRYQILSRPSNRFIKPVEDSFIEYLYSLYQGKMRYIMDAINMLIPEIASVPARTLSTAGAIKTLSHLVIEEVQEHLSPQEWKIFVYCCSQEVFSNSHITKVSGITSSNAARVMSRFLSLDLIYLDRKEGRRLFYKVSEFARVIRHWKANEKESPSTLFTSSPEASPSQKSKKKYPQRKKRLQRALEIIAGLGEIQPGDYARLLGVSSPTASRDLQEMVEKGKLSVRIEGRCRYYRVAQVSRL